MSHRLKQFLGDSTRHGIELRWLGRPFEPADQWALIFTVKADPDDLDADAKIQKVSEAGLEVSGKFAIVSLLPIDTAGGTYTDPETEEEVTVPPLAAGTYYWDVQAQSISDPETVRTVASGELVLVRDVSRLTEVSIPFHTSLPPLPFRDAVTVSDTAPANPQSGDQWLNENDGFLYIFAWGAWILPQGTAAVTWSEVLDKPVTFDPSAHTHPWSEVTGKPSTFTPSTHYHNTPADLFSTATEVTPDTLDHFYFGDVSATGTPFKFCTITALKALLKEYFDTLYWGIPDAGLPAGAYEIPGGGEGYFYTPGDYYTVP